MGGGGGGKHLFSKVGSCLEEGSAPHRRTGVTPPGLRGVPGGSAACEDRVCCRFKSGEGMRRFPGNCYRQQDTSVERRW